MLSEENYSLATFCVIVRQLYCYVNKGQAVLFGLAWLPAVCEKSNLRFDVHVNSKSEFKNNVRVELFLLVGSCNHCTNR